ncbi:MAG: TonB-dependent receptor, partial [Chitinophagales bacterium]
MKNSILLSFLILVLQNLHAQTIIKGNVVTNKKETVPGANIILQDTYDGTTSDVDGNFSFTTEETGKQILVVSFIGYESYVDTLQLSGETIERNVVLKEQFNELNAVVVTAGAFEASDEKKAAVLRPLDIVTTAGAQGDMYGALQTLPGATQVGNDDGLYVRGGSDYETKTIIDGLPVQNPYYSTVPDVPSRGRFAPFLFKGTVFSTGGYSAEYGQAMSSAIILETEEFPDFTSSGISLSPIFAGGYHVQKFNDGKTAFGGGMNYTNIGLYDLLFEPQTYEITKSVQAGDANIYFRQKTANNGIIKFYGQLEGSVFGVRFPDVDSLAEGVKDEVSLRSNYQYANISYKQILGDSWTMYLAGGYSHSGDSTLFDDLNVSNGDDALQTKATFKNQVTEKISFKFGGEYQILNNKQFNPFSSEYEKVKENYSAIFAESDIFITNDLAGRVGLRSEHSNIIDETNLAPRISLAYKTGKNSQVSVAYGDFYQTPQPDYLYNTFPYYTPPTNLGYEKATHYIANYQVLTTDRTFRVELYYKQYENLLSETELPVNGEIGLENGGSGYARGIDIFFRDKKTFENVDYWISYSFLD